MIAGTPTEEYASRCKNIIGVSSSRGGFAPTSYNYGLLLTSMPTTYFVV